MTNCCVDQFANIGKCCSSGADITLCYQTIGDKSKPCLLLLSEMGMSGIALWHDSFIKELASSNAYYIVMFDYRDCGKSTHLNRKFDTYNNSIISSRGNSSNLSQDNKLCKVEGNTLTQNNAQRRVVKSNKEMRNSDNTEKINCSSYKESNEEKCDDNDFDEENDIINELFESAENNKLPNVTNKHVRTKMSSSESKTSKCVTEINTSRSSSPSTLSIYVQLLRAFHTPGKYLVQCPYTLSDMAHDA